VSRVNPFSYPPSRLRDEAAAVRGLIVRMIAKAGSGHPGGSLSAVEIVTALYFHEMSYDPREPRMPDRDRFVLSKGHCAPLLYAVLARTGQIDPALLWTFSKLDSPLQKHSERHRLACVEASTGSLGQGVSMAAGMALCAKRNHFPWRVYAVIGCGECNEGQVWEAAMASAHFGLDNFCVILDYNQLQVDGTNDEVMTLRPIGGKFESFGWNVVDIDGHDIGALLGALDAARATRGKPTVVVARTIKGKGVSYMENRPEWHAAAIDGGQESRALEDIAHGHGFSLQ
jgi:transketolase